MMQDGFSVNGSPEARVWLFGRFRLQYDGKVISDEQNRSVKMWSVLAYLLLNKQRVVPQAELLDAIWPDDNIVNPVSAMKTLFSRLRRTLADVFGEDVSFIISQRGGYAWNREIRCIIDAEEMEALCVQARNAALAPAMRQAYYQKAFSLYKEEFLPQLSLQLWTIPLRTHYHSLFLTMTKEYATLLQQAGEYSEMEAVCSEALRRDAYDETLHILLIRSLLFQGKNAQAQNRYESATEMLYRALGVHPSEELQALYHEIMKIQQSLETDLSIIQKSLQETERRPGAFVCDFGFFREAYRLAARQASRTGTSIHLGLITVTMSDGSVPALAVLNNSMDVLLQVLVNGLRRGDEVSRYSDAQYVLMLPGANFEDSQMVMNRITTAFRKHKYIPVKLNCKVRQLEIS